MHPSLQPTHVPALRALLANFTEKGYSFFWVSAKNPAFLTVSLTNAFEQTDPSAMHATAFPLFSILIRSISYPRNAVAYFAVVVAVHRLQAHPKYHKIMKLRSKIMAHAEYDEYEVSPAT